MRTELGETGKIDRNEGKRKGDWVIDHVIR